MRFRAPHAAIVAAALSMPLIPATAQAAASTQAAPFTQCPAVGQDPSCQLLLVVNANNSITVLGDPALGPYDGSDDTLIGIVNNSAAAVPAITVTGSGSGLANLDGDGLCTYAVTGCPFGPTGYEGPGTSIKTDPSPPDSAEIDFAGAGLAPGKSAYFSLEGALTAAKITSRTGTLNPCTAILYVAARGSGEAGPGTAGWTQGSDPSDPYGFGSELASVLTRLQSDLGSGITPDSVDYPADSVSVLAHLHISEYFAGLSAGVTQTIQDLTADAAKCPGQAIILAGYSQGAMVMHRVLLQLAGSASGQQILSRVAAAILLGDGDQLPLDNEVMDGSAWGIATGIGQHFPSLSGSPRTRFSKSLAARVLRVCNWGDVVCDYQDNPLSDAYGYYVHTHYTSSKPLLQAADQAAGNAKTLHYYGGTLTATGKAGTPVSASAVVIGGKTPLTVFTGIDGTIPPWIALGVSGSNIVSISGTPPAPGRWRFDIEVQDTANNIVTIPVTITITR